MCITVVLLWRCSLCITVVLFWRYTMGTTTAHPLVGMLVGTGYIGHFDGDSSCSVYMHLSLNAEGSSENGFAFIKEMPLWWLQDKRELCAECGKGGQLLLCGTCSLVYHLDCLSPPLVTAPASPWSCPACIVSIAVHRLLPPHAASASTHCCHHRTPGRETTACWAL